MSTAIGGRDYPANTYIKELEKHTDAKRDDWHRIDQDRETETQFVNGWVHP